MVAQCFIYFFIFFGGGKLIIYFFLFCNYTVEFKEIFLEAVEELARFPQACGALL